MKLIEILLKFKHYRNGIDQKIDYRTIEFDITHYVRRQDSKENYRNGNQIMCILFHYSVITVTWNIWKLTY